MKQANELTIPEWTDMLSKTRRPCQERVVFTGKFSRRFRLSRDV